MVLDGIFDGHCHILLFFLIPVGFFLVLGDLKS